MSYFIEIKQVDKNQNAIFNTEGFGIDTESIKDIFKEMRKLYGRCVSKQYLEVKNAEGGFNEKHIGWVFEKKVQYDDSFETFVQETWVTVLKSEPVMIRKVEYVEL